MNNPRLSTIKSSFNPHFSSPALLLVICGFRPYICKFSDLDVPSLVIHFYFYLFRFFSELAKSLKATNLHQSPAWAIFYKFKVHDILIPTIFQKDFKSPRLLLPKGMEAIDFKSPRSTVLFKCLKPIFSSYCTVVRRQTLRGGWEGMTRIKVFCMVSSYSKTSDSSWTETKERPTLARFRIFPSRHNWAFSQMTTTLVPNNYQEMVVQTTGNMKSSHQTSRTYMQLPPALCGFGFPQSPLPTHPQSHTKPVALNQVRGCPSSFPPYPPLGDVWSVWGHGWLPLLGGTVSYGRCETRDQRCRS